jgi:RNA polymerase sigma-70 factor (sigma-E family)
MMAAAVAARDDEDGGFVALYRDRYDAMVRLAYLMTGSQAIAEELVQDAFVSVHRSWDRAQNPRAYLRTAVVNACRSWGRRRSLELLRKPAPPDPVTLVTDDLWDVLQTLPPRQRAAIVLRFYEDLPDEEIAALLGCKVPTVRTAVFRGLAKLRKEVER